MLQMIRYDESNKNLEALKGNYGQDGQKSYSLHLIKNVLFIQLYDGCKVENVQLPTVHDGFLRTNKNRTIQIRDSKLSASLASDENAAGFVVLQKWN